MIIKIDHYTKVIHKETILDDIDITLTSGKVYGFKGVNGSGKTMLMRAMSGLIFPTSGYVKIEDKIIGKDISFPDSIGLLIETPSFIPNYSALENMKTIASIKKQISEEDMINTLVRVGLDPKDKRPCRKYSLGMKQKLGIAIAIMERAELIILDEPFNALDTKSVEKVKQIINEEKNRGALIIMACHNKYDLEEMCDEIIEIENGRVIKGD